MPMQRKRILAIPVNFIVYLQKKSECVRSGYLRGHSIVPHVPFHLPVYTGLNTREPHVHNAEVVSRYITW